jgi:hypothetical protein
MGQAGLPAALDHARDFDTLLRIGSMLNSFPALYRLRRLPRDMLERQLLEFISVPAGLFKSRFSRFLPSFACGTTASEPPPGAARSSGRRSLS